MHTTKILALSKDVIDEILSLQEFVHLCPRTCIEHIPTEHTEITKVYFLSIRIKNHAGRIIFFAENDEFLHEKNIQPRFLLCINSIPQDAHHITFSCFGDIDVSDVREFIALLYATLTEIMSK